MVDGQRILVRRDILGTWLRQKSVHCEHRLPLPAQMLVSSHYVFLCLIFSR